MIHIADTYYKSEEALLQMISERWNYYLQILQMYMLFLQGGLRPAHMLDAAHPAYFNDAIVEHCLQSYNPTEGMRCALDRCMLEILHQQFNLMEHQDLGKVWVYHCTWEQYPLDSLLRLVWRRRHKKFHTGCYLRKQGPSQLQDLFLLEVDNGVLTLTQGADRKRFEIRLTHPDFASFREEVHEKFRLAAKTEFRLAMGPQWAISVPSHVWLANNITNQED